MRASSMWAATLGEAKISRASASGNPRQRSETPRHTFLARWVQRMGFLLRHRGATRSRTGNSSIRMTRSLDLTMMPYVSGDSFPIAAPVSRLGSQVSHSTSSAAKETSRLRWFPGLALLRSYESAWLTHDLVAGIVLTTMLAPVGIAYAVASGVAPLYGLYATIACLLAYALFGPSRILVLGPDSSLAAVIFGVIAPLSVGDPHRAIALAGVMALVSGAILIVAGIARLGFVTELLSKPIRYGYMNGIALTVLISQPPKLFDLSIDGAGPLRDLWAIGDGIASGKANWTAFAVGASTLAMILLLKNSKRLPR